MCFLIEYAGKFEYYDGMSVPLVIPAGEQEICFNISFDINETSFTSIMLVINLTDGTLALLGINNTMSFNISTKATLQEGKNSMSHD